MKPDISIIIPLFNEEEHIKKTLDSVIYSIEKINAEIIVYDDCSTDKSYLSAKKYGNRIKLYRNKVNSGPAKTRNAAIRLAQADIIAFVDADVVVDKHWAENILQHINEKGEQVVMGNTKIPKSTFLGDSIAALGFPGGGSVGFDKIWKVDARGYTDHITSCNFAARREIFEKYGVFDESFPFPGGEDPELSYRWVKRGVKIKYAPDVIVWHRPRKDLKSFTRWMIIRGRSSYLFKQKVDRVGGFISLRLWSTINILKKSFFTPQIITVLPLLVYSFALQYIGFFLQYLKAKK